MKGINILQGIADLLVQVLMLLIYVPKTLFKILKDPEWVCQFIPAESSKKEASQEYVSPVFLYIITVLIPYALVPVEALIESAKNKEKTFSEMLQDPDTLLRAAIFISIPLIVAFFSELFKSASFSRASLEQNFLIQCYYFAPLVALVQMRYVFEYNEHSLAENILIPLIIITLIWLLLVEIDFLKKKLEGNIKDTFAVLLLSIFFILILTDHIGLKLADKLECSSDWLTSGIPILIAGSITTLYCFALIKKIVIWKKGK
ncbi:MAG: hypothetical protein WBN11_13825 [Eudoraea sp.]|uniref:hypothetical protein n=1 Tax=Eudoraea sp. TaxID=1979955 RepID=UPI003C77DB66